MPDIAIGYVHTGSVAERWHRSILDAFNADRHEHLGTYVVGSPANIAEARCDVVQKFLDDHREPWLWFLDTDIVFSPDTHLRLLEYADPKERPIISAAYFAEWDTPGEINPVWAVWRDGDNPGLKPVAAIPGDKQIVQLAATGLGCLLVHRSVFEAIRDNPEYARDPWVWFGHDVIDTPAGPQRLGEDYTFCARAQVCGFKIFGINHVVGHRKTMLLDDQSVREAVAA